MTELAGDVEVAPVVNQAFYGANYPLPDTHFFTQYHSRAA
jgi:peptide/nickel transport system substrate-binding protein